MSEPAIFGLIRDGHVSYFGDRWAQVFLHRELLFGPDDFESWVTQLEELDEWEDECCGGAVADYDRKRLVWLGDAEALRIPRVAAVYERLLQAAWPGFEVAFAQQGIGDLARALGRDEGDGCQGEQRPDTVREAARIYDEEESEEEEDEEDEEQVGLDDEEVRAWVTLVGADGAIRHRHLDRLPADLLRGGDESLQTLRELAPAVVPPEQVVAEGMWIDEAKRSVGVWGSPALHARLADIGRGWTGWTVQWAERGYEQQCEVAGPAGVPMKESEALAKILPVILSTKRFDMSTVMGAMGGHLKKTAMKATGCLLVVICFPLLIFGLVSGNWKAVLISIAITCGVVMVAFKLIEHRFKRSFLDKLPQAHGGKPAPPAAGPLEPSQRRQRIDQLLVAAGLPRLAEVEPSSPPAAISIFSPDVRSPMAQPYYAEEITAVKFHTMKQCLSVSIPGPLAFAVAAWFRMRGLLRWPLKPTYGVGGLDSGQIVPRDALPSRSLSRWAPIVEQLSDLGFSPLRYCIADTIGEKQQTHALFLDTPGSTIATLEWIRMRGAEGAVEKAPLEFNSYAQEDPEIMTACVTQEDLALAGMLTLAFVDTLMLPDNLRLEEIYRRHVARKEGRSCSEMSPEAALIEHRTRNARRFQWTLEQGLLRPLSPTEVSRVRELRLE